MKTIQMSRKNFFPYRVKAFDKWVMPAEIKEIESLRVFEEGSCCNFPFAFCFLNPTQEDLELVENYLHECVKEKLPNFVYQDSYSAAETSVGNGAHKPSIYKIKTDRVLEKNPVREFRAPYYSWDVRESSYPCVQEKIEFFAQILEWVYIGDCELVV